MSRTTKVLHLITSLNDGGAQAVLYRLCTHHSGVRHHVVSLMDEGKYGSLLKEAGVAVTCLNMRQGRVTLSGLWKLWRTLRDGQPEVVQTWMYHADLVGGVLARLAGVRTVFWCVRHTTLDSDHSKRSTIIVAKLCAWVSRWVPSKIVCCAQKSIEVHRGLGYESDKMQVIPNGYDLERFKIDPDARSRLRMKLGVENQWVLGTVGRFDPDKDHKTLLRALAKVKEQGIDFSVLLVGHNIDSGNEQLIDWLTEFGLQGTVQLLGARTDIENVMNALDVHVLSSCSEAFPNVVAESMACGTPVVTTDVGDAALIVGKTGWVVPPRDPDALAGALMEAHVAIQSTAHWAERSLAARRRVEDNFSIMRMVDSYDALWGESKLDSR